MSATLGSAMGRDADIDDSSNEREQILNTAAEYLESRDTSWQHNPLPREVLWRFSDPVTNDAYDAFISGSRFNGCIGGGCMYLLLISMLLLDGIIRTGVTESVNVYTFAAIGFTAVVVFIFLCCLLAIYKYSDPFKWRRYVAVISKLWTGFTFLVAFPTAMYLDLENWTWQNGCYEEWDHETWGIPAEEFGLSIAATITTPLLATILLWPPFWLQVASLVVMNTIMLTPSTLSVRFKLTFTIYLVFPLWVLYSLESQRKHNFMKTMEMKQLQMRNIRQLLDLKVVGQISIL